MEFNIIGKVIKMFFGIFWKIITFLAALASLFGFLFQTQIQSYWKQYIIFVFLLSICISLVLLVCRLLKLGIVGRDIPEQLLKIMEIIDPVESEVLFDNVDRFFQLKGFVEKRIELGDIMNGKNSLQPDTRVRVRIDNLGWASFLVHNDDTAIKNINEGIKLAEEKGLFYWAAKGERHLSGIEWHHHNEKDSLEHLEKAKKHMEKIQCGDKTEMEGSLLLTESKYKLRKGKSEKNHSEKIKLLDEAEIMANEAMKKLEIDNIRKMKVYAVLGNIYLEKENWNSAREEFEEGFKKSNNVSNGEYARNALGLARLFSKDVSPDFNLKIAKKYIEIANSNKTTLYPKEQNEILDLFNKLNAIIG